MPKTAPTRRRTPPAAPPARKQTFEVVDPRWLLKALGICFTAALVCGYATLCLLFYQGEWQLILHPSHTVDRTPDAAGLAWSAVRFDSTETGQPRLTGWWIPAAPQSELQPRSAAFTILYLHGGSGSLSDTNPALVRLHQTGLNIFAIDYRGFGNSDASVHPSAERMEQDASAALDYLTGTRHLPPTTIVPFGAGLAGSLAASLALAHHDLPAVILDNPNPEPASVALAAHPADPVPVRLLFGNQFDVATPLSNLTTPKLLIAGGPSATGQQDARKLEALFTHASSPRMTVTLPTVNSDRAYQDELSRFLDQYLGIVNPAAPAQESQ
jgi:uncharacterized protein